MFKAIALFYLVMILVTRSTFSEETLDQYLVQQQEVMDRLGNYLKVEDITGLKSLTHEYISSEIFNPFIGFHVVNSLLMHTALLDVAEELNTQCIAENSSEYLGKIDTRMDNIVKEDWMFKELYSQRSWIRWKKKRMKEAWQDIQQTIEYRDRHIQPSEHGKIGLSAEDLLRIGIIGYEVGEPDYGWVKITEGLILDKEIIQRNPDYQTALSRIVKDKYGEDADLQGIIGKLHETTQEPVPTLELVTLDGRPVELHDQKGKAIFINFFSPICGSCQQEIAHLKKVYDRYSDRDHVAFFFVMNRPDLEEKAIRLFQRNGITDPTLVKLKKGSTFDYIRGEPTTWIVDRQGIIVERHIGYTEGDEQRYDHELAQVLGIK